MFAYDKKFCPFRMISMETKYCFPLPVMTPHGSQTVYIGGVIDRIDETQNGIRIIDYKTGSDTTVFKDIYSIFDPATEKRNKAAFQTLLYCLMFEHNHPQTAPIIPGVYSTKLLFGKDYNYRLKYDKEYIYDYRVCREDFLQLLAKLIERLYSPDSFTQTADPQKCKSCKYSVICNR